MPSKLQINNITMTFRTRRGDEVIAVDDLSLHVDDREFISIVGPSGCGKSTLLRVVAGLIRPNSGSVTLDNKPITEPGADRGMVFQTYTLFPWLTVQGNVEYGPRLKGLPAAERDRIVRQYIGAVGLTGFERSYPKELSGGMMQRVAIARTLAIDPRILLMDEPFGALDAQTRSLMQAELLNIWRRTPKTVIFVTHDVQEAVFLADRVAVMSARPGRIKALIDTRFDKTDPHVFKSKAFADKVDEIWGLVRDEAIKAQASRGQ